MEAKKIRVICGKYDNKIDLSECIHIDPRKKIRIGSTNPNVLTHSDYDPIGTDGNTVFHSTGIFKSEIFLSDYFVSKKKRLVVLTHRERYLMLDRLLDFDLDVVVFEGRYPIFSHIKYVSSPKKNYLELNRLIKKVKNLDIRGKSLANYLSTKNQFKIERKVRYKTKFDPFLRFGYQGGYQEVFKVKEERSDRVIIALDFNSMFSSCMYGDFLDPRCVSYKFVGENYDGVSSIKEGLYRVILKGVKEGFFKSFHPFKYTIFDKKHLFEMSSDHEVEILLFKNEIEAYAQYFQEVFIVEGLVSHKRIKHPLYKEAVQLYKKRINAGASSNDMMSKYYKFCLLTLHSASNPKRFKRKRFKECNDLKEFLEKAFMIDFSKVDLDDYAFRKISEGRNFEVINEGGAYKLLYPVHDDSTAVYSLSAQVLANSRIKMMSHIGEFLKHPTVEVCYANVDSLHLSISRDEKDLFLEKHKNLISDEMGKLKIECIADTGYWFDVGRYWLFKDGSLIQFKNKVLNHVASDTAYARRREIKYIKRGQYFSYVKSAYVTIENSFSFNKRLKLDSGIDHTNFSRYSFDEVENLEVAGDTYDNEVMRSKAFKIDLFDRIATV